MNLYATPLSTTFLPPLNNPSIIQTSNHEPDNQAIEQYRSPYRPVFLVCQLANLAGDVSGTRDEII